MVQDPENQASEERICRVEKRGRGRVQLDKCGVFRPDIAKPEVRRQRTENRVSDHHEGDVDADYDEDAPALLDHLIVTCRCLLTQLLIKALQEA